VRGGGYGEAAAKALPDAVQVADRWHLMENASAAFLDAVRKSMRAIRGAIGTTTITPELLTSAEKLRYESYLRREDTNTAIVTLARDGVSIKQIVRRLGHSRNLVRQTLRGGRTDMFQTRQRSLDAYYLFLEDQWSGVCRNGAELWRRCRREGSGDPCVRLASGQHVDVGRKRSANNSCKGFTRPELSPVS
jgi:transposase